MTASEPIQGIRSAEYCKDSFSTIHLNKTSKDCPVGFANFGPVSLNCLQFSVGSNMFACMSCCSCDVTLHIVELRSQRCQLSIPGPYSDNFIQSDSSKLSQNCYAHWLLTNNQQITCSF